MRLIASLAVVVSLTVVFANDAPTPADTVVLYSLDGLDQPPEKQPKVEEKFYGFPVYGKTELKDPAKRKEVLDAVTGAIVDNPALMAKCFWPRHGLRVVQKGKTVDYVICFECSRIASHSGSEHSMQAIKKEPQALLTKVLKDAGVKLSPSLVEK
jgi:hypothetical protein